MAQKLDPNPIKNLNEKHSYQQKASPYLTEYEQFCFEEYLVPLKN